METIPRTIKEYWKQVNELSTTYKIRWCSSFRCVPSRLALHGQSRGGVGSRWFDSSRTDKKSDWQTLSVILFSWAKNRLQNIGWSAAHVGRSIYADWENLFQIWFIFLPHDIRANLQKNPKNSAEDFISGNLFPSWFLYAGNIWIIIKRLSAACHRR